MNINEFLAQTNLFRGITPAEIESMSACLHPKIKQYSKDETVYRFGDVISAVGIVLSGAVSIERCDAWGNKSIIDKIEMGEIFGESYACLKSQALTIDVVATEKCKIIFFDISQILCVCTNRCAFHTKLVESLIQNLALKNVMLSNKMRYLTPKSIRARLISYLSAESFKQGGRNFDIPFNRQQLADYLSVDRSALSNELSKMHSDGLIDYYKNSFRLNILDIE